ncbi:MAG: LapA family protein [Gemmatimonadota bacterium]|nr:LapA family protein [Gemmatimonadota bacterium]
MKASAWLPALMVAVLAAGFAFMNRGETATIHLFGVTFFRVPLTWLTLGSFLLGMITMFALGLRHDLRVRRTLRAQRYPDAGSDPHPELG